MSLTVTQRPSVTRGGGTSKWNAVGNPIVYRMQRKDYSFNSISNNSGYARLQFTGIDLSSFFTSNDSVYVQSDDGSYDLNALVQNVAFSAGNTLVTLDAAYTVVAGAGFVNNETTRQSYRIEVHVFQSSDDTQIGETLEISPTYKGALLIDIAPTIRPYLLPDVDQDITDVTEVFTDPNVFLGFYIKYTEVWIGSAESQTNDSANQFFAVLAAMQIPARYGGNIAEYVAGILGSVSDTDFSTGWTNHGTGIDWTFATDMSVLIDQETSKRARRSVELASGNTVSINIKGILDNVPASPVTLKVYLGGTQEVDFGQISSSPFDLTESPVALDDYTYIEIEVNNVGFDANQVDITEVTVDATSAQKILTKLDEIVKWRGWPCLVCVAVYEDLADNVYAKLGSDTTTPADYSGNVIMFDLNNIATDENDDSRTLQVLSDSTPDYDIVTPKTVVFRDECQNPVMLVGRNSLGGVIQWLFDGSQEYTFDYGNDKKAKRLTLVAENLTINQWEALQDFITLGVVYRNNITELTSTTIKTSTRVGQQLYVIDQYGEKTGVVAIPTRNTIQTKRNRHRFEIEIEFPEQFEV